MRIVHLSAALTLGLAVACGAFGAHALKEFLVPADLGIWEKAVFYQFIHGLAALVTLSFAPNLLAESRARRISWLFLVSIVIFSGSLYLLVLSGQRWLGAITPIGGLGFMLPWVLLALELGKARPK